MTVEVLFVADCPSHALAVKRLRDVLATEGILADVREVLVADERMAKELRFPGSPTIRINGRDVAQEMQRVETFALCCRLYSGSKEVGIPPTEMIRRAVIEASRGGQE